MAIPLGLTLPLMEGEPTTYFASRLAARNFLKARPFAADMGFSYSALDRGCEIAISRLSEISGVSAAALAANASHRVDEWLHLRGQFIDPKSRRNSQLAVCPACLEADIARGDFAPQIAIRGRLPWMLKSIRTCAVHGMALVNITQNDEMQLRHDWSQLVTPILPQIKSLTDGATRRPPSKLERYLINRLEGDAAECCSTACNSMRPSTWPNCSDPSHCMATRRHSILAMTKNMPLATSDSTSSRTVPKAFRNS